MPYFVFLKLVSFAVHVGLPFTAFGVLLYLYFNQPGFPSTTLLVVFLALTITFQLLGAIRTELRYSSRPIKEMWKLIHSDLDS